MDRLCGALGLLLLVFGAASGVVLPRRRGWSLRRIGLDALAMALGGSIGVAPGAYLWIALRVTAATGTLGGVSSLMKSEALPVTLVVGGAGAGSVLGLACAETLMGTRPAVAALARGFGGSVAGSLVATLSIYFVQNTRFDMAALLLIPLTFVGMTLAGYASRPAPRLT